MKKIIALFLCLLIVGLCFTGCRYVGKTDEYELYDKFARRHDAGMTKQEVFDKLGCPDIYGNAMGQRYTVKSVGTKKFNNDIFNDTSIEWCYDCYKYERFSGTYRLEIRFDSEGKSIEARLVGIN